MLYCSQADMFVEENDVLIETGILAVSRSISERTLRFTRPVVSDMSVTNGGLERVCKTRKSHEFVFVE